MHQNGPISAVCSLLGADRSSDSGRAWTPENLLERGRTVTASLSSTAVELLATGARAEDVVLVGKRVSPFTE
jgi:hypothetical protein